jgi:hypothetical protein
MATDMAHLWRDHQLTSRDAVHLRLVPAAAIATATPTTVSDAGHRWLTMSAME